MNSLCVAYEELPLGAVDPGEGDNDELPLSVADPWEWDNDELPLGVPDPWEGDNDELPLGVPDPWEGDNDELPLGAADPGGRDNDELPLGLADPREGANDEGKVEDGTFLDDDGICSKSVCSSSVVVFPCLACPPCFLTGFLVLHRSLSHTPSLVNIKYTGRYVHQHTKFEVNQKLGFSVTME